jgi:formamidopyrimidine-DNA glycosylase
MPELPEIASRAKEMQQHLTGKKITSLEVIQPKSLNESVEDFSKHLVNASIQSTSFHGKWILTSLTSGWLLLNMGMGGEILLINDRKLPSKYRLVIGFADEDCLSVNFWWFGYAHYAAEPALHPQVSKLGKNALEVDLDDLAGIIGKRKTPIKTILLDQTFIAGIGNAYIHDILFLAKIHPLRPANSLSTKEQKELVNAIHRGLEPSLAKGGAFYEVNLFGQKGGFQMEDILVGYREGQPCPVCRTPIIKLKTGSTSSFICPSCQK